MQGKKITKLGTALLIACLASLCIKVYLDSRNLRIQTLKLETKIESMLKQHPNKLTLVEFLQNKVPTIHSVIKISDISNIDPGYWIAHKYAPSDAYWDIGITAVGPIDFGRSYDVFFDRNGKFLIYHSEDLINHGLDF